MSDETDAKLRELVTLEFMTTLETVARIYGWSGDYHEVVNFIQYLSDATSIAINADRLHDVE